MVSLIIWKERRTEGKILSKGVIARKVDPRSKEYAIGGFEKPMY